MRLSKQDAPLSIDQVLADELESWQKYRPAPSKPAEANSSVVDRLHRAEPVALCLSGGGIRSATFGLGVLQGLARKGLLDKFDYISTVSGGGYIGSWLTSWLARSAQATKSEATAADADWRAASKDVFDKLAEGDRQHPFSREGEQEEISHLRSYSNYLTPKLGLLTADTWTLAATYLRNVIVNWFVLLPFFLGVLALPRIWTSALAHGTRVGVVQMTTLLAIAGLSGLVLVIYLASVRPVPNESLSTIADKRRYGVLFAVLGPGMLVIQALAMCYVRSLPDPGTGTTPMWWDATWKVAASLLPFGPTIAGTFQSAFQGMELLISLMLSVILLNHIGWAIYTIRLVRAIGRASIKRAALELFGATVAGAAAGWFLWLIIIKLFAQPMQHVADLPLSAGQLGVEYFITFAPALYLLAFFVQTMMFVGITGKLNDDEDREWWARWAGWLLILSIACIAIGAIAAFGPLLIVRIPRTIAAVGGITGIITLTLGRSGVSPATQSQKVEKGWKAILANLSLAAAAPIFVIVVFSAFSFLNTWLLHIALDATGVATNALSISAAGYSLEPMAISHFAVFRRTPPDLVLGYTAALFMVSVFSSLFVQVNRFSMHGLYRNRLTRAYLGASNSDRRPNAFTGFDEYDNINVEDLPRRPFHVVNVALNLVSGGNLAWQERKAASFTISPLHCGSKELGFRPSSKYARHGLGGRGITLGTAMAISGAAVSPNMGYHTSPAMSFLLTLFNVRLGWWLGNPKKPLYGATGPSSSLLTILAEAFGKTNKENPWVYLSDGGHFENLGLYEMVRRRCHYIVVSDAGRDPEITFEDLGNAIRKIRIDLGIPITIDDVKIYPRDEKKPGRYFATGTIHYDVVDRNATPGVLIYLKPSIYGKEPIDIRNYATQNAEFPHESTSDQWFTESQFESYRALGAYVVDEICARTAASTLQELVERLQSQIDSSTTKKGPRVTDGLRQPPSQSTETPAMPHPSDSPARSDRDIVK